MSNQKDNGIVIPPRYETLGRSRPQPRVNHNQPPLPNYGNNYNYNSSPNVMPFQRHPPNNIQMRQSYQAPPPQSRLSYMSTSSVNMNYGTVNRQNTQSSYRSASPSLGPRQTVSRNTRGIQYSSSPNNAPGYYPVIPTRDISRYQNSSSSYRHSPNSSVSSIKTFVNDTNSPNIIPRNNTISQETSYYNQNSNYNHNYQNQNQNQFHKGHAPKNSISSLFTDDTTKIDEPVIPLRGKGSYTGLNKIANIPPTSINDLSSNNRNRSPSVPVPETSPVYNHVRSQSYTSVMVNNMKNNAKGRSNSSGNTTPVYNYQINSRQTKSEDNAISKQLGSNSPALNVSTPVLGYEESEYDSPVESPKLQSYTTYSPNLSAVNESMITQGSPNIGTSSPMMEPKKEVVIPPRRGNYKTQSIYSNFSVMTSTGEVMEYNGIQSLDTIEEMLKSGAFNDESLINETFQSNYSTELVTQPVIEEPSPIVIPTRTKASIHPKSSTTTATDNQNNESVAKDSTTSLNSSNNENTESSNNDKNNDSDTEIEPGIIEHSALLSEIAQEFMNTITLVKLEKESIEYTDCFTGADAVTTVASIIGTKNRKLALAICRSLASEKFFHDILYTDEFLDSSDYIYQMTCRTSMPYNRESRLDLSVIIGDYIEENSMYNNNNNNSSKHTHDSVFINSKVELPKGVFVAISSCYSPTCSKDSPCYSYSCPRRKAFILKSGSGKESKTDHSDAVDDNAWSTTVDKNILAKVDDHERKRQEVIYEFIQSEKEYVDDLISVTKLIRRPLIEGAVPKIDIRFVNIVFSNIEEILSCNAPFSQMLQNLQQKNSVVDRLGDITLEFVKNFTCYIRYGEIQPLAKEVLQYHRSTNSSLEAYLKQMQSQKEFRRLPLESFLARPTTRLGRYPILIKDILKHTKEGHPDQITLNKTMEIIQNILKQVNEKAGRTTNKIKLDQWGKSLDQTTMDKIEDILILKLTSSQRRFIREGTLLLKREGTTPQEVDVVFLDNAFVITRKKVNTIEIIRKPIPIQLLKLINNEKQDEINNKDLPFNEKRYSFTVVHMGYKMYTFMTKVYSEQKSWIEAIEERLGQAQRYCIEMFNIYSCHLKINSAVVVKDDIMIFANENGLYTNVGNTLTMILPLQRITNIDIMPDAGLLFVLIDKEVIPYSIDALLKGDLVGNFKKPRKLCSGISFMKIGFCDGHHLLCAVKTANTNSTVRSYEPNKPLIDAISAKTINKKVSTIDVLIPHKQFYIPAEAKSIQFLKRALCVGCTKGFEVVNINTLTTQSLFDTHDPAYEWIIKEEYNPVKLIKTIKGDFLVCYNKVGFFLDKNGNPSRGNIRYFWMNSANSFAYISPYILAISNNYIEVWDENDTDRKSVV